MIARRCAVLFLLFALLLTTTSCSETYTSAPTDGELLLTFLDVGQADCAVIRTASTTVVIDTGDFASAGAELLAYLDRAGVGKIDLLVLSHPHEDHVGGAPALLESRVVAECLMPDLVENGVAFRDTLSALRREECEVTRAEKGVVREYGDLSVEVLSPTDEFYSTVNDAGAVIRVRYGNFSALFMADVSAAVETELIALYGGSLASDIVKVAHHGSSASTGPEFLSVVAPRYAVISCEAGNEYGFPHPDLLARLSAAGIHVQRTDTGGTVVFSVKDGIVSVKK